MTLSPTDRSTVRRNGARARTERTELYELLDRNLVCHLGVVVDGAPRVLPTGYGRDGDTLYLHGSTGARSLRTAGHDASAPVCVTVTELRGIVYARAAMHFSANYASAVVHGECRVLGGDEKLRALRVIAEHLAPGSWDYVREPNAKELAKTTALALDLADASVKVRDGGPGDEEDDLDSPVWAGVLPVERRFGAPVPSADLHSDIPVPAHVAGRVLR